MYVHRAHGVHEVRQAHMRYSCTMQRKRRHTPRKLKEVAVVRAVEIHLSWCSDELGGRYLQATKRGFCKRSPTACRSS